MPRLLQKAGALLTAVLIPACADPSTQPPATSLLLEKLPRVENSRGSPCWQQKQIAAQNSYIDTVKANKETIYKAPCEIEGKQIARAK